MTMSRETDLIILGLPEERFEKEIRLTFRHWQCFNVGLSFPLEGRVFSIAYVTESALLSPNWPRVLAVLERSIEKSSGLAILPFSEYVEPTKDDVELEDPIVRSNLRRSRHAVA